MWVSSVFHRNLADCLQFLHTCNPSTWEMGTGGLEIQGYLQLQNKFKASLSDMTPSLKKQKHKKRI